MGLVPAAEHQPEAVRAPTPLEDAFASITATVPDAVIAATATEHGATVVTMDRDPARFPSVPRTLLIAV